MPAPTNTSALTATDFGTTMPVSVTQDVYDSGTAYTVWYRYTAQSNDAVMGIWGFGDLVGYFPTLNVWTGPASSPSIYIVYGAENVPLQMPVVPGTEYFFQFVTNSPTVTPAVLQIEAEIFSQQTAAAGSIFINDDTDGFPAALLSDADGSVLRFVSVVAGEYGNVLTDGTILLEDTAGESVVLYDDQFNELASISNPFSSPFYTIQVGTNQVDTFYIGMAGIGGADTEVTTVDDTGALGPTMWNLGTVGFKSLNPSNDETILYYGSNTGSNGSIKRWDLINDVALSDLAVAGASDIAGKDVLVLGDDSIITLYRDFSGGPSSTVWYGKRYDAAGTTLNTYTITGSAATNDNRIALDPAGDTHFWMWIKTPGGISRFDKVVTATGVIALTFDVVQYEAGIYQGAQTATPSARFGHSESCPFFLTRTDVPTGGGGSTGTVVVQKLTAPSSDTTDFDFVASGGLSPTSLQLQTGESYTYNSVTAGSGYSVVETANPTYTTTVTVSTGEPNTNFTVTADETVVVTFTNSKYFYPNFSGTLEDVPRRWLRRSPVQSSENRRIYHEYLNVDFQPAVGINTGQGSDPQVMMRWSDDGGLTWGNELWRSIGKIGATFWRAVWWRLGMGRNRVYEVSGSDPVKTVIQDAYVQAQGSTDSPTT